MIDFDEVQFKSLMDEVASMRASGELLDFSKDIECPVIAIHGKTTLIHGKVLKYL